MRLLADENFDAFVIQALRDSGHDVRAIRETDGGAPDDLVIEIARNETRVFDYRRQGFRGVGLRSGAAFTWRDAGPAIRQVFTEHQVGRRG